MTEKKARKILEAYAYQLRDRKPFEYSFIEMHEAIISLINLLDQKIKQNKKLNKRNVVLKDRTLCRIDYIKTLEKDLFEKQEEQKRFREKINEKINQYKAYIGTNMYKKYNYAEIIMVLQELLEE